MKKRFKYLFLFILCLSLSFIFLKKTNQRKTLHYSNEVSLQKLKYSDLYYFDIEIENQRIPVLLDTGSCGVFTLNNNSLKNVSNKQKISTSSCSIDINGNEYNITRYQVGKIRMGDLKFKKVTVEEKDMNFFFTSGTKIGNSNSTSYLEKSLSKPDKELLKKTIGLAGASIFKKYNWLIDFPNSKMYFLDNWEDSLNKLNISLDEFVEISIRQNNSHIVLSLVTDFGIKNFALDTGADKTFMRCPSKKYFSHQTVTSKKFSTNTYDFGKKEIYLLDFPSIYNFQNLDGFLGIDFLKERIILLDSCNNRIFISRKKRN